MIKVTFVGSKEACCGFILQGHADYADKGQDIVCSAISALAQTTIYALVERHKLTQDYCQEEGRISCSVELEKLTTAELNIVNVLLLALYDGLTQIRRAYGGKYVHIEGGYYENF